MNYKFNLIILRMEEFTMSFGNKLKELRKDTGLTQAELAGKIGIDRGTLANYETNRKKPSYDVLEKLANVLNCSVDYMMGINSKMKSDKIDEDSNLNNETKNFIKTINEFDQKTINFYKKIIELFEEEINRRK
ncbi:MAG: helix-turn-helix domain-containing protein [Bacillota bacterium]